MAAKKKVYQISGMVTFYFDFLAKFIFIVKFSFHNLNHPNLSKIQNYSRLIFTLNHINRYKQLTLAVIFQIQIFNC